MNGPGTHSPRRLLVLIVGVTVVPLGAFVWLGWRLGAQERAIEAQRRRERVELSAERVVAAVERAVSSSERVLAAGQRQWSEGAVAVTVFSDRVDVAPARRLAYLPTAPALQEVPQDAFTEAEVLEFRTPDRQGAIAAYARLATSANRAVRAGALLRMARNQAMSGEPDAALRTYAALAAFTDIAEASVPIDLAAAWGRCSLLAERHRTEPLRIEAGQLLARLRAGDWPIPEAVYLTYAADARRWSGNGSSVSPSEVLAGAVSRIWADGPRGTPQAPALHRRSQTIEGTSVVTLAPPVDGAPRALIALPSFVEREWLAVARVAAHEQGVDIASTHVGDAKPAVSASSGRAADFSVTVAATQSGLPWTFTFRPREGHADTAPARRQLLWSAFALLAVLWVTASTLILRSVRREFAVARLQADFVAAVSHEFRTPLTTLRQFTERLRAQPDLDQAARLQCYDAQSRATERLSKLVESVLDFGRMEAGARPYAPADRDCAAVVERAVAEFRDTPQAACHPVTLSRNGAMPAAVDDEALSRAVTNLLDNAAKYSPDGAAISVILSSDRGEGRIAVSDRGIGIPPNERKRLFLKFQRGDEARRLGIKGTGIGLAMVDHIVRAHAGRVEVESEPGRGSTFTIVLPLKG